MAFASTTVRPRGPRHHAGEIRRGMRVAASPLPGVVLSLVLAACAPQGTPSAEPPAGDVTLVPGAALTGPMGPEGGELTATDAAGGRTYRLTVPAGAFAEATQVTVSPIAAIAGFPFDGVLLGGVELDSGGAAILAPMTLEIGLDSATQAALRTALEAGQVVAGFSYPDGSSSVADDLGITLADIGQDASTVTLTLTSFSGHGAGTGSPQKLRGRPCPTDPVRHAECEIHKILHPPGGQADPTDPAVRMQVAQVLRDWLDVLEVAIDASTGNPQEFRAAIVEAREWWTIAFLSLDDLVTAIWSAPGDELHAEGQRLGAALEGAWRKAFDQANSWCQTQVRAGPEGGLDLDLVLALLEIHAWAVSSGLEPPGLSGIAALQPAEFCVQLTLTAGILSNPTSLDAGDSGEFNFRIKDSSGGIWRDTQLDLIGANVTVTPADPAVVTAAVSRLAFDVRADVRALKAVGGSTSEGTFEIAVRLFGSNVDYASLSVPLDVTSKASSPISCTPVQTSVTAEHGLPDDQVMDHIFVRFSEGASCTVEIGEGDVPDAILVADTDSDSTLWDAEATGSRWSEVSGYGKDRSPGTHTLTATSTSSGKSYQISVSVFVSLVSGGPETFMIVQNVTITPV